MLRNEVILLGQPHNLCGSNSVRYFDNHTNEHFQEINQLVAEFYMLLFLPLE